jgi:hypothetical protein
MKRISFFCCLIALTGWLLLTSCADPVDETESAVAIDDGAGGIAAGSNLSTQELTKATGEVIATFQYDADVFVPLQVAASSEESLRWVLGDLSGSGLTVAITRIAGRSDTACRYQAAVLARDHEFEIDDPGWKINANDIRYYWVRVQRPADDRDLYCAELVDRIGFAIIVSGQQPLSLNYRQVHFLLNSLALR